MVKKVVGETKVGPKAKPKGAAKSKAKPKTKYGQMPILTNADGKSATQSKAMSRYQKGHQPTKHWQRFWCEVANQPRLA